MKYNLEETTYEAYYRNLINTIMNFKKYYKSYLELKVLSIIQLISTTIFLILCIFDFRLTDFVSLLFSLLFGILFIIITNKVYKLSVCYEKYIIDNINTFTSIKYEYKKEV